MCFYISRITSSFQISLVHFGRLNYFTFLIYFLKFLLNIQNVNVLYSKISISQVLWVRSTFFSLLSADSFRSFFMCGFGGEAKEEARRWMRPWLRLSFAPESWFFPAIWLCVSTILGPLKFIFMNDVIQRSLLLNLPNKLRYWKSLNVRITWLDF